MFQSVIHPASELDPVGENVVPALIVLANVFPLALLMLVLLAG